MLARALEEDDVDAVNTAAGLLNSALNHLGEETTFYGHAQNRVRDAATLNSNTIIARKKELGLAQDTDLPEAIIELNLAGVHQQAALGAQARRPTRSLFDFLG
jgi:flagellin-like hook-associated protein FlgL